MRVQRRGVLSALALVAIAGCGTTAKHIGSQAAEGAIESIQQKRKERPQAEQGALAERAGSGAVRGAVEEISKPENLARLSAALERGVSSAFQSFTSPRVPEGGGGSESPAAALGREMGAGAIAGSCPAADPAACFDQRARDLGRSVSAGMVEELWARLHWPLLAAVFIVGFLVQQMARVAGATFRRARARGR